jgi:hypothetical protein
MGFLASQGARRTHQESCGYACHLVPRLERGGRRTTASHQSRHRTLPRPPGGSAAKPQQSRTIRTTRPYPAVLQRPVSQAAGVLTPPTVPGPTGAKWAGCKGVGEGSCCRRRSWAPTQVTGRNPLQLRFRSHVSAAVIRFCAPGVLRPRVTYTGARLCRRQLRFRSRKTCKYGSSPRAGWPAKPE